MVNVKSLWIDTTPDTSYPDISLELKTDVAIIGGGIVGITAAYLLKKMGKKVVVIESGRIVKDVTGNTTAKITSAHGIIYKRLIDTFGTEKAKLYAQAQEAAKEKIHSIINEYNIDCDFLRKKAYTFTESEENVETIKEEVEAAHSVGLPVSFVQSSSLPFPIKGAICYENQAQFHPRKYLLELAKQVDGDGSCIVENTRALDIKEDEPCKVTTDKGVIYAKDVIVATHFPFFDRGLFFSRMTPHKSYVVAVTTEGQTIDGMFYSMDETGYSFRTQPYEDGEVIFVGGEGHKTGQGGDIEARYQRLEEYARKIFKVKSVEYKWSTQDNKSFDGVPFIGRDIPTSKHIFVATGFGGWGMTNGTVAAMLLPDLIQGKKNEWSEVFDPTRIKPMAAGKSFITENMNVGKEYVAGKLGGVVGKKKGPTCTHMGCALNFNNAEKTWDCPCHGSRFSKKGKVLHGPAVKDLDKEELSKEML